MGPLPRLRRLLAVALAVLVVDQATKAAVVRWLALGEGWPAADSAVGQFFRILHVHNTGVAFGMFQGRNDVFTLIALAVIATVVVHAARLPAEASGQRLAFALVTGGAVGNLVDRLRQGHVTDFLDFRIDPWFHWPTFNAADSAIFVGVVLLIWEMWKLERAMRAAERSSEPATETAAEPAAEPG